MNPVHRLFAGLAALAGMTGVLLVLAAATATAALAKPGPAHTPRPLNHPILPAGHIQQTVHEGSVHIPILNDGGGGVAGWQIALIVISTTLIAAAAVFLDRAWVAHRKAVVV